MQDMRGIKNYYRVLPYYIMSTTKNPELVPEISHRLYTTHDSGKPNSGSGKR